MSEKGTQGRCPATERDGNAWRRCTRKGGHTGECRFGNWSISEGKVTLPERVLVRVADGNLLLRRTGGRVFEVEAVNPSPHDTHGVLHVRAGEHVIFVVGVEPTDAFRQTVAERMRRS